MKKLVFGLLFFIPLFVKSEDDLQLRSGRLSVAIPAAAVFASHKLGKIKVYHDGDSFHVEQNERLHRVEKHDTDHSLRRITSDQLKGFIKAGYVSVRQFDDGSFTLKANVRGLGGGAGGAAVGTLIGKCVVHVVGHTLIATVSHLVGRVCGENGEKVAAASLEATFFPIIQSASNVAALAGGIIGGIITGPI